MEAEKHEETDKLQNGKSLYNNINLFYQTKKKSGNISEKEDESDELTIHDKQAIIEATLISYQNKRFNKKPESENYIYIGRKDSTELEYLKLEIPNNPINSKNFLQVNIGFLVSSSTSNLINFFSKPINSVNNYEYTSATRFNIDGQIHSYGDYHSEERFFLWLNDKNDDDGNNLRFLLKKLLNDYKLEKNLPDLKVHSLIFDMHTTQDMCPMCLNETYNFIENNIGSIKEKICELGFSLPKSEKNFKLLFRVSSILELRGEYKPKNKIYKFIDSNNLPDGCKINLKLSEEYLILHGNSKTREKLLKWYRRKSYEEIGFFNIDKRTIFLNSAGGNECLPLFDTIPKLNI